MSDLDFKEVRTFVPGLFNRKVAERRKQDGPPLRDEKNCKRVSARLMFFRLLDDRIIMLCEKVYDAAAALVVAQILYLEPKAPNQDIQLYINSPGGSVTAGMAVWDTMQDSRCDGSTICMGAAAGMGAFLLSGGARGKRIALPNAKIMIHQPFASTQGRVTDMEMDVWNTSGKPNSV